MYIYCPAIYLKVTQCTLSYTGPLLATLPNYITSNLKQRGSMTNKAQTQKSSKSSKAGQGQSSIVEYAKEKKRKNHLRMPPRQEVIGISNPKYKQLVIKEEDYDDSSLASSQSMLKITNTPNATEELSKDASLSSNTLNTTSLEEFPPLPDSPAKQIRQDPSMISRAGQTIINGIPKRDERNQEQCGPGEDQTPLAKGATPKESRQEVNKATGESLGESRSSNTTQGEATLTGTERTVPINPYRILRQQRMGPTQNASESYTGNKIATLDKPILLKKDVRRSHIHRYDLQIKVKASKSEEEEFNNIQNSLQKKIDIAIQADSSSIIPPNFELERSDKSVPDISSKFLISSLDSIDVIKRYFSRLSQRNDKGNIYCSVILAHNIPFLNSWTKPELL